MSVVVSYNEDSHSVIHEFNSYLPLKNLHYASSSKSHVINDLSITFKKFTNIKSSVLLSDQSVFLHLFFVFSDDAEFYKTNIRKQIQDWLNSIASKKTQEWLVIHVSPALSLPDSTTKKRFYSGLGSGGSILDRIKSDFSTKRERCCGLKLNDEDSWKDFLGKVKEGILSSFSMQVQQFDEDIKRLDSQRLMPGWNYCQFFILKETSALLFESMTLYEDALLHYDELEASFFQTLAEQGAPWFTTFGGTDLHDDSDDILNFKKKPYRELIFQNKITIFDFRVYLFSRQVLLVEKLGRVNEVCVRAKKFLVEFVRNLREYRFGLPNSFCESWVYSACMSVVSQCEELVVVKKFSSFTMMAYESAKAELLHLARMQLDSLGKISGLYNPENDSIYTPEVIQLDLNQDEFKGITNTELKKALTNVEFFDELYLRVTNRAMKSFESSNRTRTMWLLKNDIANLHFTRHNYQLASSTWSNMVFKYSAIGWTCIDAKIIQKLATCFKSSNEIEKYIQSLVFLVSSACAESDTQGGLFEERIVRGWVLELNSVLPNMSEPMDTNAIPIFRTNVLSLINKLGDDDGLLLEVEVWSKLPEKFFVDEISVLLDGGIQSEMTFQIFKVELNPGSNILRMVCDSSSMPGTYAPKSTQIKISKLNFHCEFEEFENVVTDQGISAAVDTTVGVLGNSPEFGTNAKSFKKKNGKFLVKRITNSILVDVGVPDIVSYKNPKNCIRFRINSCASTMKSSSMNVTSVNGELQMKEVASVEFTISNNNGHEQTVTKRKLETIDGNIMLPDVSKQSIIEFDLEYLPNFGEKFWNQHELKIVISYTTDNEKRKLFLSTEKLKLNIPFNVSHDVKFLKDGRAILQFNVTGVDDVPLRFNSNSLDSENLNVEEITGCDNVQTIFRNQNHSYLYLIDVNGFKRNEKLKFSVNYHSVHKEIESFLQSELTRTLSKFSKEKYAGFLRYFIRNHVLTNLDYLDYAVFEEFSIFSILFKTTSLKGSTDDKENGVDVNLNVLKNELESEDELVCAELAELMEQFFKQLQKIPKTVIQESLKVRNYTVDYEFSIPFNKVILLCEYVLDETSKSCKLGELINVDIIVSIQEWQIADIQLLDCVLEIEIDNNHWMISGRRKELLKLQKNNHHNKSIILAPLQPGLLPLPKITINTIPQPMESTADLSTHENQPYQIDTILPNSGTQILVLPQSESHKIFIPDPTPQSRRPSAFGGPIPPSKEQQQLKQFMYPMRTSLPPGLNNRVSMIRSSSSPVSNLGKAVVGGKN